MQVWKVCIRPDPESPDLAQRYVLAADRENAFATVDHPDAEVFEADSAMRWPGHVGGALCGSLARCRQSWAPRGEHVSAAHLARVICLRDGVAAATVCPTGPQESVARRNRPPEWPLQRLGQARNGSLGPPSDALVQSVAQTVRVGLQFHSATSRAIFDYTFAQALSHLREPVPIREHWTALKAMCWPRLSNRLWR